MLEDAYPESSWNRNREWKAIPGGKKMQTKEAIKFALTVSDRAVLSVIDEMSGAATTFPTPNGGATRSGCWVISRWLRA